MSYPRTTDLLFLAAQIDAAALRARAPVFAGFVRPITRPAQDFDLLGHHLPEGLTHGSSDQFVEDFARFAFAALQKGRFQFFVCHGGGWFFGFVAATLPRG